MRIRKQTAVIVALTGVTGFLLGAIKDQSPITRGMLTQSEKVVGLQFTAAEKDSMIDDLADNLESYNELRAIYIDNSVPPSLQFNPVPVGKKFEKKRRRFVTSPPNKIAVPENLEELAFHSVRDLAELIRKRKITSTQLTRMYTGPHSSRWPRRKRRRRGVPLRALRSAGKRRQHRRRPDRSRSTRLRRRRLGRVRRGDLCWRLRAGPHHR